MPPAIAGTKNSARAHFVYSGEPGTRSGVPSGVMPPSAASAGLITSGSIRSS